MKWRGMQGWRPRRTQEWFRKNHQSYWTQARACGRAGGLQRASEAFLRTSRTWNGSIPTDKERQSNKSSRFQTRQKTEWNPVWAAVEPPWVTGVWEVEEITIHPPSLLYSVSKNWDDFLASFNKCTNFKTELFFSRLRRKRRYQAVNNTCRE